MYYVYFLKSKKAENWIYTGSTVNLKKRFLDHSLGKSLSTKPYLPVYWRRRARETKSKQLLFPSRGAIKGSIPESAPSPKL